MGMICSEKHVLTENLCAVHKEEIFNNMLQKNYDHKDLAEKKILVVNLKGIGVKTN
jgi:hypothetical protein